MRAFLFWLILTALPAPLLAQSAAPTPVDPADAAKLAAAERVLDAMNYDSLMQKTIDATAEEARRQVFDRVERSGAVISDAKKERLSTAVRDFMKSSMAKHNIFIKRGTAAIYAKHFSVDELDRLAVLQRDPLMRKFQAELPGITAELLAMNEALMSAERPRLLAIITEIMTGDDGGGSTTH